MGSVHKPGLNTLPCHQVAAIAADPMSLWRHGCLALESGDLDGAIACHSRAAALDTTNPKYHIALGHALARRGRLAEALSENLRTLTLVRNNSIVYYAAGRVLQAQGRLNESVLLYRESLNHSPSNAAAWISLADALRQLQQPTNARDACEIALSIEPDNPDAHRMLGVLFASQRDWHAALSAFQSGLLAIEHRRLDCGTTAANASEAQRDDADLSESLLVLAPSAEELRIELQSLIGDTLRRLGFTREAIAAYREALTSRPTHVRTCRQFAVALECAGDAGDAAAAWVGLGVALQEQDRFDEARTAYQQALARKPDCLRALINLGRICLLLGEPHAAIRAFDAALAIDPQNPVAHTELGRACHQVGDIDRAWDEFAWFCHPLALKRRAFEQPLWDGAPLGTRSMLVWAEQALGDTIQWLRYVSEIKRLNPDARLIVECQPNVVPLARRLDGVDLVIGEGTPPPRIDVHVPLSLIPVVCRPCRHVGPWRVPYLSVDHALVDAWRRRLDSPAFRSPTSNRASSRRRLTVGLSWAGHPDGIAGRQRFTALTEFAPLSLVGGVRFVSLQIGRPATQILGPPPGMQIEHLQDDSHSTHDTAALMESLDIIITVDTMVAHLAGALARAVWMVLPHVADWRWSGDVDRTGLYPTMTLFRQTRAGDWRDVFERVAIALASARDGTHPVTPAGGLISHAVSTR